MTLRVRLPRGLWAVRRHRGPFVLASLLATVVGACARPGAEHRDVITLPLVPLALVSGQFRGAEGIAFTGEGRLFVTADRTLWEVLPDGTTRQVAALGSTVGLAPIGERDVLVAEFGAQVFPSAGPKRDGVVLRVTPEGLVDTIAAGMGDPNFILVRRDRSLLVSDDFTNEIWEVTPEGTVRLFTSAINHPNGMVESPDGRFL